MKTSVVSVVSIPCPDCGGRLNTDAVLKTFGASVFCEYCEKTVVVSLPETILNALVIIRQAEIEAATAITIASMLPTGEAQNSTPPPAYMGSDNRSKLRKFLVEHYTLEHLGVLYMHLEVDFENYGPGLAAKARGLIGYMQRRSRMFDLLWAVQNPGEWL